MQGVTVSSIASTLFLSGLAAGTRADELAARFQ
jgi:hypothetical protein